MKGPPKKATTNIEVAGSAASHGLTLLIYMTCCQLVPSMSLRHFQVGAKKQGIMVTFTEWNLLKWPYWLQVLPLTLMWMILIAEMMGSEPLHTWPMFLHSQVFNELDTSHALPVQPSRTAMLHVQTVSLNFWMSMLNLCHFPLLFNMDPYLPFCTGTEFMNIYVAFLGIDCKFRRWISK